MTENERRQSPQERAQRVQRSLAAARQRFASLPPERQARLTEEFRQADAQAHHARIYRRPE